MNNLTVFVKTMWLNTNEIYSAEEIRRIVDKVPQNKWFTVDQSSKDFNFWQQACKLYACVYRTTPIWSDKLQRLYYSYYFNHDIDYTDLYDEDEKL